MNLSCYRCRYKVYMRSHLRTPKRKLLTSYFSPRENIILIYKNMSDYEKTIAKFVTIVMRKQDMPLSSAILSISNLAGISEGEIRDIWERYYLIK